jgi:hypothetical protein
MNLKNQTALILSALVLSFGGLSISAESKARQCVSTECACERALERNTVEALEIFLREHQHDASSLNTACAALALPSEPASPEDRKAEYSSPPQPDMSTE